MAEEQNDSFLKLILRSRIGLDLAMVLILGVVAYLVFRRAGDLQPMEGAILMMVAAGLLGLGRYWWRWQRSLTQDGVLGDWVWRILQGERAHAGPSRHAGRRPQGQGGPEHGHCGDPA